MNLPPLPAREPVTGPAWLTWFTALVSGIRSDTARLAALETELQSLKARVDALEAP